MVTETTYRRLGTDLTRLLAEGFPGMVVEVGANERWDRPCIKFCWSGFAGLLPEERFHRLVGAIPEAFRTDRLGGFVWLELAPRETIETFLELARSEDVAEREGSVYCGLLDAGFFESLAESLGGSPEKACPGDFSTSADVLADKCFSSGRIRDAKLVFIRCGAYCDCQVLESVCSALAELHASAV